jgi:hypothetical protein
MDGLGGVRHHSARQARRSWQGQLGTLRLGRRGSGHSAWLARRGSFWQAWIVEASKARLVRQAGLGISGWAGRDRQGRHGSSAEAWDVSVWQARQGITRRDLRLSVGQGSRRQGTLGSTRSGLAAQVKPARRGMAGRVGKASSAGQGRARQARSGGVRRGKDGTTWQAWRGPAFSAC